MYDGGEKFFWAPRFDPDIIGEQGYEACDSGGYYWVTKSFSEGLGINRIADRRFSAASIGFVNRLVNGGGNGYYERQAYTAFMVRYLSDSIDLDALMTLEPPAPKSTVVVNMLPSV